MRGRSARAVFRLLRYHFLLREQDKNFLQPVKMRRSVNMNRLKRISRSSAFHCANGKTLRKYAILSRCQHCLAGMNFLIVIDVIHAGFWVAAAFDYTVRARFGEKSADAAVLIIDQKHLRGAGKDLHDFSDYAVRSDDGEVTAEVVALTAIDKKSVR